MLGLGTRSTAPQQAAPTLTRTDEEMARLGTVAERRRILAKIATEAQRGAAQLARLAAQAADAADRETRARALLDAASADRALYQGEHLAASAGLERRLAGLHQDLIAGAPPKLDELVRDVALLVEDARWKADSKVDEGYQTPDGRWPMVASTNAGDIAAFKQLAARVIEALKTEQQVEAPSLDRVGPLARVTLKRAAIFRRAQRESDAGDLAPRSVVVPLALAEASAAIMDAPPPKPFLSPGAVRFVEADAEAANKKRWNSGEAWR